MKVLILAYDFPPLISIGGQRPYGWCKYLPEAGISVTVVTRRWSESIQSPIDYVKPTSNTTTEEIVAGGGKVIRTPFAPNLRDQLLLSYGLDRFTLLRKTYTFLYSYLEHLFFLVDSKSSIYRAAEKAIEQSKPDFIIATGEPFILFKYGHKLSAKHKIPWVADYRDGWTTNQGNYKPGFLQRLQNNFYRLREKKYVQNASFITTASPTYVDGLKAIHPNKQVHVVYNGFDEEFFRNINELKPPADKFIISYAGTIYPHQNLEMFLDGLAEFVRRQKIAKEKLEVRFYGIDSQPEAKARLLNYRPELKEFIVPLPKIPYGQLIQELRKSHLLLLLSRKGADWLNAKVFDYLAVKRSIMLVENDHGILERLLKEAERGIPVDRSWDVCAFLALFENALFKKGAGSEVKSNDNYLKYSRKAQALVFAELLQNAHS